MRGTEIKIGKGAIKGFLLGKQSADYFDFVCGNCGGHLGNITVEDVDTVGFRFTAKCGECKREWKKLKISALWGKPLEPHITARIREKWAR